MKIQSTKEVTYYDIKGNPTTEIMTGDIFGIFINPKTKQTDVDFKYVGASGFLYAHDVASFSDAQVEAIYPLIKDNIPDPDNVGFPVYTLSAYYEAMKITMAERFPELEVTDIEIV